MLRFNLEQEDWSLKAWSEWKEGLAAEAVGFKYTDPADMDGSRQLVWCNDYDRCPCSRKEGEFSIFLDCYAAVSVDTAFQGYDLPHGGVDDVCNLEHRTVGYRYD